MVLAFVLMGCDAEATPPPVPEAPKAEAPASAPKVEAPKAEPPKVESLKAEAPKDEAPKGIVIGEAFTTPTPQELLERAAATTSTRAADFTPSAPERWNEGLAAQGPCRLAGEETSAGCWVLGIGVASLEGKTAAQALAAARLSARAEIAAFLGEQVAASSESTLSERDGKVSEAFRKWVRTDVDTLLRGARDVGSRTRGTTLYVALLLTERTVDASAKLASSTLAEGSPDVVRATGQGATAEAAAQAACRDAVAQVLGASLRATGQSVDDAEVRTRVWSDVQGLVSEYRVERVSQEGALFTAEILARVDRSRTMERYGAQLRTLGEPMFSLLSDDAWLGKAVADFLAAKGFRVTERIGDEEFRIELTSEVRPKTHPRTRREGRQLSLTLRATEARTGETLFALANEPGQATSFVGTDAGRQHQLCREQAMAQIAEPLGKRLRAVVSDRLNNGVRAELRLEGADTSAGRELAFAVAQALAEIPGGSAGSVLVEGRAATVRFTLRGALTDLVGLLRKRVPALPAPSGLTPSSATFTLP